VREGEEGSEYLKILLAKASSMTPFVSLQMNVLEAGLKVITGPT
jgi:hypothetical protein